MRTRSCGSLLLALVALPLLALGGCKSDATTTPAPGPDAAPDSAPDLGPDKPGTPDAGPDLQPDTAKADTTAAPDSASSPSDAGSSDAIAYFVKQTNGTAEASLQNGSITVSAAYSSSGNGFKYVAPNYYGTLSNAFIAASTPMKGDFSISAEVTITTQNKANNACGVGVGMTTGFNPTDTYGYMLMRNNNNSTNGYYVNGAGTTKADVPTVSFQNGTPLALSLSRAGKIITLSAGPVGGTPTSTTLSTSSFTDGTNVFGDGPVYPAVSYNNVVATIAKLVIKDSDGNTVFDSATGRLVNFVPAALTLSSTSVSMNKGDSVTVTATANAVGGAVSTVTATSADSSIATAEVAAGDTSSTITITGKKGGVTTITVTNTGDSSAVTNSKTIMVAVNEYPATDDYGSKGLTAYPAPGATSAYRDGEFALTFDAPPTLNQGGTIKIFKLSDGKEADSIGFADETQAWGSTTIKVGSQLVRVDGNTLTFTPHLGKLAYGTDYYVVIPTTSITGTINGVAFAGLSNSNKVATWKLTTQATPTLDFTKLTVDGSQTSTADFRSLAAALNAVSDSTDFPSEVNINVAAGTYRELLRFSGANSTSQTITISGPSGNKQGDNCVVAFANGNAVNASTSTRPSFYFTGANLVLKNITLKNTATRAKYTQAETLYFASGGNYTVAAYNSSFISNQDTLQVSGRGWFYKSYVEGNVDFLWGTAQAALFESCDLHLVSDLGAGNVATYSMIVARTGTTVAGDGTIGKGFVVLGSTVTVDADITASFGRNAGAGAYYDQAALINVTFTGAGTIGAGMWNTGAAPASLGDSSYVGWKSTGCTGLNLDSLVTSSSTSATIAEQATEYDTRDHILNRVVTIKSGAPTGHEAVSSPWDTSALAKAWGAP
jgi:hypothetical protein